MRPFWRDFHAIHYLLLEIRHVRLLWFTLIWHLLVVLVVEWYWQHSYIGSKFSPIKGARVFSYLRRGKTEKQKKLSPTYVIILLVVSTHLKNISQIGSSPQVGVNKKKYLKPPPRNVIKQEYYKDFQISTRMYHVFNLWSTAPGPRPF